MVNAEAEDMTDFWGIPFHVPVAGHVQDLLHDRVELGKLLEDGFYICYPIVWFLVLDIAINKDCYIIYGRAFLLSCFLSFEDKGYMALLYT